jgi:hypothetical protein
MKNGKPCFMSIVLAVLLVSFIFGCGNKSVTEGVAEKAMEQAAEKGLAAEGKKADVDVKRNGDNLSITVKDENNQKSTMTMNSSEETTEMNIAGAEGNMKMQSGSGAKIPENFPKDVPLYPGVTLKMVMEMEGQGYSVVSSTTDAVSAVSDFYKKSCIEKGWTESMVMAQGADNAMLHYQKDERILMVVIGFAEGETTISITVGKN